MTVAKRLAEARLLLREFGFDAERSNERSAKTLLALLRMSPDTAWPDADNPMLRTVEIIEWINDNWDGQGGGTIYKPNTRETFRRRTLHQFIEAGLVELNPDNPSRAINSPANCYQVTDPALDVIRAWGTSSVEIMLRQYLEDLPGLVAQYAAARALTRIPITLPDGSEITVSPGGQNVLIKQMVEDFCGYYVPGGHLLYVGDADSKLAVFDEEKLAELGVTFDHHGKMPDLVVYLPDKNWLVLMEAASTHGPVDAKRHAELANLFGGSTAGLVYVSCFPSRAEMRKYLHEIAWETEVWCADAPEHLIHFNGERFLGPYK